MAHECIGCGSECYCHGDIDDCVVSHTPTNCEGCGCCDEDYDDYDDWAECDAEDDRMEYRASLAATCTCGAWQFDKNGNAINVADCCCGAE